MRKKFLWYLTDTIISFSAFIHSYCLSSATLTIRQDFLSSLYVFIIWTIVSSFTKKQKVFRKSGQEIVADISFSNVFILGSILVLIRSGRVFDIRFLLIYFVLWHPSWNSLQGRYLLTITGWRANFPGWTGIRWRTCQPCRKSRQGPPRPVVSGKGRWTFMQPARSLRRSLLKRRWAGHPVCREIRLPGLAGTAIRFNDHKLTL